MDQPSSQSQPQLPAAITDVIDGTNDRDRPRFLGAFAENAIIDDWGRSFAGRAAIAGWNDAENMGTANQITVTGYRQAGDLHVVTIDVTGRGYNGPGTMTFTLDDGLVTRIAITA